MKVCLSSRQDKNYLAAANEIKVQFRDRKSIPDLIMDYPDATIILENPTDEVFDWEELKRWNVLSKERLVLCVKDPAQFLAAKSANIKVYFGWIITDFETLNTVVDMGACYVRVGGSLFFDLDRVIATGAHVRAVPNIAFDDGLVREDGVAGTWIRPEDLEAYGSYIEAIEFADCDLKKEQALYRIYMEQKAWPGDLGMIVTGLNHIGVNRMIHPDIAERRMNCRQKCKSGGACRICYRLLTLANPDLLADYAANKSS